MQAFGQAEQEAVFPQGLDHVAAATGLEAADVAQQRAERDLVDADQPDQDAITIRPGQAEPASESGDGSWLCLGWRGIRPPAVIASDVWPGRGPASAATAATAAKVELAAARQDDQVDSRRQLGLVQTKGLADQPLDPVAGRGPADLLPRDRDPQPGMVQAVLDAVNDQHSVRHRPAPIESAAEVGRGP